MDQYFSQEGLEKLNKELEERLTTTRGEIAKRIQEAKENGDLAENADYDVARKEQQFNESRIEELKEILENAVVMSNGKSGFVGVGSEITVDSKNGKQKFVIVGSAESNPAGGFISNESPLGKAFMGHKKGDSVEVLTPKGSTQYKISEVN